MTDKEILEAVRAGGMEREKAWEYMYKNWRGIWLSQILKQGGTKEEALEAHDEAFMAFEKAVSAPDFQLHSARLSTYLTICIVRRWNKITQKKFPIDPFEDSMLQEFIQKFDSCFEEEECKKLLDQALELIDAPCNSILTLWASGYKMDTIAEMLGIHGGGEAAKKKKYKCQDKLKNKLKNHPALYNMLKDCLS